MEVTIKKTSSVKKGAYAGCDRWAGSIIIDDFLTLYYEIVNRHDTFYTKVGSDKKFKNGFYIDCEDFLESLAGAKLAIESFVSKVKNNPSEYYPEE